MYLLLDKDFCVRDVGSDVLTLWEYLLLIAVLFSLWIISHEHQRCCRFGNSDISHGQLCNCPLENISHGQPC